MASTERESIQTFVRKFRDEHQDQFTIFVMMRFGKSLIHNTLHECIARELDALGMQAVRADDCHYAADLWANVQTYMLGADAGIVIFDNVTIGGQPPVGINPNVSVELGYMMGLDKPWLMLKDRHLKEMPVDLRGILFSEFNGDDPEADVRKAVRHWAQALNLTRQNS